MDLSINNQAHLKGLIGEYKDNKYPLNNEEFIIGRSPQCDLIIEEETVSAQHAKIIRKENQFEILDLNSSNGTFVNGDRIDKKLLRTDDIIKFDVYEFQFLNPLDVPRTVVFHHSDIEEFKETVVRSPMDQTVPIPITEPVKIPEQPQTVQQGEPVKQEKPLQQKRPSPYKKKGNIFGGIILGLLVAFLIGYGGSFLGVWSGADFSTSYIQKIFLSSISVYPLVHIHTTWINAQFTVSVVITLSSILLALIVGGFVTQRFSRRSRLIDSFSFSFFYVLIALFAQLAVMGFRFDLFERSFYIASLGIQETLINLITSIAYFFVVSFMFSYIGTHISRK